ncbi:MAG: hypothetical protein IJC07_02500 [Clostridia bacterium]|nr:hypothetical protein [Clostridia bacterium]
MEFLKKVLVLKQVNYQTDKPSSYVGGIARLEMENGTCSLFLSLINFPAVTLGSYQAVLLVDDKDAFFFDLPPSPTTLNAVIPTALDFNKNFSFGIVLIKSDIPLTIAFSTEQKGTNALVRFNKVVAEKILEKRKSSPKKSEDLPPQIRPPYPPAPSPDPSKPPEKEFPSPHSTTPYDDEAVATVNYFDVEMEMQKKLQSIKEADYDNARVQNELPHFTNEEETKKGENGAYRTKNETDCSKRKKDSATPYVNTVKAELNEIFKKFPAEKQLESAFPFSRWAKITYEENKFYVVGVIKQNKTERYICYGVPGKYSPTPPESLAGYCTFIPLSIFNVRGDGYWMMFQDAITGVRVDLD